MNDCEKWERMNNLNNGDEGWVSSRLMPDNCCCIIYEVIGNEEDGYVGYACNNAFGFEREAVRHVGQKSGAHYKNPYKLMERIEKGNQLWVCTGFGNIGEYTKTIEE